MARELQSALEGMTLRFIRELLTSKWLWIVVFGGIGARLSGFLILYIYLALPSWAKMVALISILVGGAIVAGIKDYASVKDYRST